jgi:putative endonuclease
MSFRTYILNSKSLKKYYTGYTSQSVQDRLNYHLGNHTGFTAKAKDWAIIFEKQFEEKSTAMALEKKIKKRGAKRFLGDLES